MVVIATGYFAKAKEYAANGYALVSIARVAPWFLAKTLRVYPCDCLAPTDDILALRDKPVEYEPRYRQDVLAKIDCARLQRKLEMIAHQEQTGKLVLLCYERPEKFCHRHIVAEWLESNFGGKVEEIS